MEENYFVITSSEDGIDVQKKTKEELIKAITPNEYGETDYGKELEFLKEVPEIDNGCWYQNEDKPRRILILKGKIFAPKPKKIVKEWDI